jgi:hypothetical protein
MSQRGINAIFSALPHHCAHPSRCHSVRLLWEIKKFRMKGK